MSERTYVTLVAGTEVLITEENGRFRARSMGEHPLSVTGESVEEVERFIRSSLLDFEAGEKQTEMAIHDPVVA